MQIAFFIPIGLIFVYALVAVAGIHILLENLSSIFFNICNFFFNIYGIFIIVKGIYRAKNENCGFLYGLSETIRGLLVSFSVVLMRYFLELGKGIGKFEEAEYVFFGFFDTLDINIASLLLCAVILLIVSLPVMLLRKNTKILCPLLTVGLIILFSTGVYQISVISAFNNNYGTINWESPEYEIVRDATIKQKEFLFTSINSGEFSQGEQVYTSGGVKTINEKEHILVTNGEKMGYVDSEYLKSIVTYSYIVNVDSEIYGIERTMLTASVPGGGTKEIVRESPSENAVAHLAKGTEVKKIRTYAENFEITMLLVQLSDGTKGYVDIDHITEIRQ